MAMIDTSVLTANMTEEQRAVFYGQMSMTEKDEVAGVLLALFLGTFGAHHFYLRRTGLGILYLVFFWSGITAIAGIVECFLMPGRVRRYNAEQAAFLAASLQATTAGYAPSAFAATPEYVARCSKCGSPLAPGVRFCASCGTPVQA